MNILSLRLLLLASVVSAALFNIQPLLANTTAGTDINNKATLTFKVGGSTSADLELISSPNGNTDLVGSGGANAAGENTTFVVDRIIDFQLEEDDLDFNSNGDNAQAGQTGVVLTYTIENTSNAAVGFAFHAEVNASTVVVSFDGTEFTNLPSPAQEASIASNARIFLDDGDTIFDGGILDTELTAGAWGFDLEETGAGASKIVFVSVDIANTAISGDYAKIALIAQATEPDLTNSPVGTEKTLITADNNSNISPGGSASTIDDIETSIETVFADDVTDNTATGPTYDFGGSSFNGVGSISQNGQSSATDVVFISNAEIALTKVVSTIWDPLNLAISPKAVPGAYIEFVITVENTGGGTANLSQLEDILPSELAPDLILLNPATCSPATPGSAPDPCDSQNAPSTAEASFVFTGALPGNVGAQSEGYLTGVFSGNTATLDFTTILATSITGNTVDGDLGPSETVVIKFNAIVQ